MSKTIMTVDDSPTIRQALNTMLVEAGYAVIEAVDGHDAMSKLQNSAIDMLITDLNMPRVDGIELIKHVRNDGIHRFMPIIMLTTESQETMRKRGKAAGASAWVTKPFRSQQILGVVRMVLP